MKSLEALEKINFDGFIEVFYKEEYKQIKNSLEAFEIIKEKEVDVEWLLRSWNLTEYNDVYFTNKLTQEDFDFLREVLIK